MPLVAGVDSSTQSTKVEIRDAHSGALVGRGQMAHPIAQPPRSEQQPSAWWEALDSALSEAALQLSVADVAALSVAGQQHGLVVLDRYGSVVRPAKLWNDTESARDASWLVDQLGGPSAWTSACGSVPVAAFTITKLAWLRRAEPESWERLAHVCLPHDYLTWRLSNEHVTDRGDASGTGYFSAASGEYRFDLLEIVDAERDWTTAVPRVLQPDEPAGECAQFGLRAVVAPGTGDNMAGALGMGLRPGDLAISLGTSGTAYVVSERPTGDASGAVAGFADASGRFLPLVCTLNATKVTDAVARLLGVDRAGLDELALAAPPGAGDVVVVPYFDGERTPNRPGATGTITGLRSDVGREQLARAAFEGVVCGVLEGVDALADAGVDAGGALNVVGGGSRSSAYLQVIADLASRPVTVPEGDEHVARGACVQAAAVLHGADVAAVAEAWRPPAASTVEPDTTVDAAEVRERYARARG